MGEAEEVSAMLVSPTNVSVPLIAPS
ncbi:ATP-dependent Lon protease, partial|nr:ATP-dependent Lon protease [Escherichia coli]